MLTKFKTGVSMKKKKVLFIFLVFSLLISLYPSSAFSGTTTLTWDPPSINADGTPLTDLAGYMIYYGTNPGNYSQSINVGDVTTYTVNNLTEGLTYYFVTTAYDAIRNESEYSNETYKIIPQQFSLGINKNGTGKGTVTSSPTGINCGSDCSEIYTAGRVIALAATCDTSSIFAGWSEGVCSGTGTCTFSMNSVKTITATFNLKTYSITATSESGGSISPAGSVTINHGSAKTFTITPNSGYKVVDIVVDGASVGAVTAYTFSNVTTNHTIHATFTQKLYDITVSKSGTGTGTIASLPAGINCGSVCSETYSAGAKVTLTATPNKNSCFAGWSGACSGTGTCTITMNSPITVSASFISCLKKFNRS
jgi:hypothetical protein